MENPAIAGFFYVSYLIPLAILANGILLLSIPLVARQHLPSNSGLHGIH